MSDNTEIQWTDATWNIVTGCSVISPGCTNCYAMKLAGNRLRNHPSRVGLTKPTKTGPVWTGAVRFNEEWLTQPLQWKRPRKIFVCAHADLFHENVPDEWVDKVFAVMALARHHTFQVLTKRPERMKRYLRQIVNEERGFQRYFKDLLKPFVSRKGDSDGVARVRLDDAFQAACSNINSGFLDAKPTPPKNVWLGVSVEDQKRADERIPVLLETPAAIRFISAEPLLGPVDLTWLVTHRDEHDDATSAIVAIPNPRDPAHKCYLDWIIVGGESGPGARPMHPAWARSLRDQCVAAGVAFHFKQQGAWIETRPVAGGDLGSDMRSGTVKIVKAVGENDGHFRSGDVFMRNVGKKAAGRLLDGRTWDEFPEAP